ncbi:MAG: IS4 family transposase [Verrucomicrobia bacterium]|nr:IS4 family transposase [Verrucomicrobiota bacterium]
MTNSTPFFAGFHHVLFGRKQSSAQQQLRSRIAALREGSLCQLAGVCEPWTPSKLLEPTTQGANSRRRSYTMAVTFWAFLSQVMSPDSPCRETVRKVQAWHATRRLPVPSTSTGAYCQARSRLPLKSLHNIQAHSAAELQRGVRSEQLWLGRHVKVVDGTGVSMPDTPENQAVWPQSRNQTNGCGFPTAKLVGCFCLASGALLDLAEGNKHIHESRLFRKQYGLFNEGDVALTDRGFCSYLSVAELQFKGVDTVMRIHKSRPTDFRKGKRLGPKDRLITWTKPIRRPKHISESEWQAIPETLTLRMLHIQIDVPGFRTESIVIVTTLTDPIAYPAEELAKLYLCRWSVELFFRDIKITLGMDVLRCRTPEMVRKEIALHVIAYNLIRGLMQQAAALYDVDITRLSFKGSVDTLRQWTDTFNASHSQPREQRRLFNQLLQIIAEDTVPYRPERSEPRVRKRRPKNYRLMTWPRHQNAPGESS